MSGRHEKDRANTKPGDLRAEMAKRVGLTVEEQNRCRREGASFVMRVIRRMVGTEWSASDAVHFVTAHAERRWGPDWEVDG